MMGYVPPDGPPPLKDSMDGVRGSFEALAQEERSFWGVVIVGLWLACFVLAVVFVLKWML